MLVFNFGSALIRYSTLDVKRDEGLCLKYSFQSSDNLIRLEADFKPSLRQAEFRELTLSHSAVKIMQEKWHVIIGLEQAGGMEGGYTFVLVVEAGEDRASEGIKGMMNTCGFECEVSKK